MSIRRRGDRRRRKHQELKRASQARRSKLKQAFHRTNNLFSHWRQGWVAAATCFMLTILATLSPVLYAVYKDRGPKKNEYQLVVILRAEFHGQGTLEVKLADPNETPPKNVDLAMYWQIFNSGLKPIQIVEYSVEIRSGQQWNRFRSISLWQPRYLVRRTQSQPDPMYIDVSSNYFDQIIKAKTLLPGNSIDGWVFLELAAAGNHQFFCEQIKVRILDIEGRAYNINPRLITEEQFKELSDKSSPKASPGFTAMRDKL